MSPYELDMEFVVVVEGKGVTNDRQGERKNYQVVLEK
jgi:hypothetical protein